MIYEFGDRTEFAINIRFVNVDSNSPNWWGGIEFWLSGHKLGDTYYLCLLNGSNRDTIEQMANFGFLPYPFQQEMQASEIIEAVFEMYSGNPDQTLEENSTNSLRELASLSEFWGRYIIFPNNSDAFDNARLVCYSTDSGIRFIYKRNFDEMAVCEATIDISLVKNIAASCLDFSDEVFNGVKLPKFTPRELMK